MAFCTSSPTFYPKVLPKQGTIISHISSRFRWEIENFSRLKNEVHFSDTFSFGSRKWRILIYPRGNNANHLSIYLEAVEFIIMPSQGSFGCSSTGGWSIYNSTDFVTSPSAFSNFSLVSKDVKPSFAGPFGSSSSTFGISSCSSTDSVTNPSSYANFISGSKDVKPSIGGFFGSSSNSFGTSFNLGSIDQIYAEFSLAIVNQIHNKYTVRKEAKHKFTRREIHRGFRSFVLLSELNDPNKGYIVNDTCIFEVEVAVHGGMENSTYDSGKALSDRSTQTELQVGVPIEVVAPIAEMNSTAKTVPGLETQTELEGKRNETVWVAEEHGEVHLEDQVTKSQDEVSVATTQSGDTTPLPEYSGAGQLFEEGRHRQSFVDDKFEDIGGFSVLKTQVSLYKQIWLKYGHIATSEVLVDSYSGQVSVVFDIMTCVMCMHEHRFAEVSSAMIESWGKKIKMAEKLEFNIKWLQERFEDIKKDFDEEPKLKTALIEQDEAEVRFIEAEEQFILAKDELKKAEEKVSTLKTRINPLHSGRQMYLQKGSRSVLDGLF